MYVDANLLIFPTLSFPHCAHKFVLYVCLSLFLPCKSVHQYHFSRFHTYVEIWHLLFSFWLTSLCMTNSRFVHLTTSDYFVPFYGWVIRIIYIYTTTSLSIHISVNILSILICSFQSFTHSALSFRRCESLPMKFGAIGMWLVRTEMSRKCK